MGDLCHSVVYSRKALRKLPVFVLACQPFIVSERPPRLFCLRVFEATNRQEVMLDSFLGVAHNSNVITVCLQVNNRLSPSVRMPPFLSLLKKRMLVGQ